MDKEVKALAIKADDLSSNPQDPHGRREQTSSSCPLTSTCALFHMQNK